MEINTTINGQASAALAPFLRLVYDTNNQLAPAGAEDVELGVNASRAYAQGDGLTVIPLNGRSVVRFTAASAMAQFDKVYGAASGKVSNVPNGRYLGIATESASGDGSYIGILIMFAGPDISLVQAKTADFAITPSDSGKTFTTVGATATVTASLPAATVGLHYNFRVGATEEFRIDPNGTETLPTPTTGVAGVAGKYLTANADGETLHIICTKAGEWSIRSAAGTWTFEA